jgi:glyceraldehyde 3-phosphate dehydrogenase
MTVKVGINGFGRIGRNVLRAALSNDNIEIVAINDLTAPEVLAHLLQYDSVSGIFQGTVSADDKSITVNGKTIKIFAERELGAVKWGDLGVEYVVESTGLFTDATKAVAHIEKGGAKKVIISAPAKNEDLTIVLGVNQDKYDKDNHHVVSNASCTTNCLAPMAKVIDDEFGIVKGFMTTVHSYTNDQRILDLPHKDLRRARAAAVSIIPTTTGAAKAVGLVLPHLSGKLDGMAMRVPTPNVSIVDLVTEVKNPADAEKLNAAFKKAAEGPLKGVLEYCVKPLVSRDFVQNPNSSIIDALSTAVLDGNMVKTVSWYDNEWGYSVRVVDLIDFMSSK